MRVGPSICAAILSTLVGAVPRSESGDLGAVDGSLDLFTPEASEALSNDLPSDTSDPPNGFGSLVLQADPDETSLFDNLDPAFDATAISNSIDSSCLSPASKRDVFDEGSVLAESPASCNNNPVTTPLDLTIPTLDPGNFDLLLEGSQEINPSRGSAGEQSRKQKPWWSPDRIPFFMQSDKDGNCDKEQGLTPVCCWTWANTAGKALRCIYYDTFKCLTIKYQLCCEFLDFMQNPYNDEYRDAYGCPWDGGFASDDGDRN